MQSQLYIQGKVLSNPELGRTRKDRLWVKILLESELIRPDGRGGFQTEIVTLPVSFFSREAETVKGLKRGDHLTVGCHLYGTRYEGDTGTKYGVQLIADAVFLASRLEVSQEKAS